MKDAGTCAAVPKLRLATDNTDQAASSHAKHAILDKTLLNNIYSAVLEFDKTACLATVTEAMSRGITPEVIADRYVPAVSLRIGEDWCEDRLNFAQVTIGVARLQAMLRDLGPHWAADAVADAYAPSILMMALPGAHHTLGCTLLAGQLRRRGYSVRLALDLSQDELARLVAKMSFDAVFISASQYERLEKLHRMVKFLRTLSAQPLPIAVGGTLLDVHADVAQMVGVDIATSDIDEAITHCGLTIMRNKSVLSAVRN